MMEVGDATGYAYMAVLIACDVWFSNLAPCNWSVIADTQDETSSFVLTAAPELEVPRWHRVKTDEVIRQLLVQEVPRVIKQHVSLKKMPDRVRSGLQHAGQKIQDCHVRHCSSATFLHKHTARLLDLAPQAIEDDDTHSVCPPASTTTDAPDAGITDGVTENETPGQSPAPSMQQKAAAIQAHLNPVPHALAQQVCSASQPVSM
jgi:hypothetical protein